jgi:histidinol-phosphate aminotransferase
MKLIRPLVQKLHPYVPGEQPKIKGLIKLNTNENPYPPSPKVLAAVRKAADGRLRLYPNPTADALREALAAHHGCKVENIIVGNGSDELLALAIRAFVEPASPATETGAGPANPRSMVQYFTPSYSLYPVLADIHGAVRNPVALGKDFTMPSFRALRAGGQWNSRAALTFITTPNAPTGLAFSNEVLAELSRNLKGVVVLDEAYVDFADQNALELALQMPNVLVARTFSKAYSLCFQRVGYFIGPAQLIEAMHKIRDSYNVNGLGQVAALATLSDLPFYRRNFKRIRQTRSRVSEELTGMGFSVLPSQTNFIFARPPGLPANEWYTLLRDRAILVRWFNQPGIDGFLRITIGTEKEAASLVKACRQLLREADSK